MPTAYEFHRIIFVTNSHITPMNAQAKNWDPDTGGDQTFGGVLLSGDGEEPSTHTACNTRATTQMKNAIDGQDNTPFVTVYDGDDFTWQEALDDMGLQVIEEI